MGGLRGKLKSFRMEVAISNETTLTERKRRDILAACISEFRDYGFAAARIDRIAERAKVSKKTLYRHFRSKEAMLDAITATVLTPVPRSMAVAFDASSPLRPQLLSLLKTYAAAISEDNHLTMSRIIMSEFITDMDRSHQAFAKEALIASPLEAFIKEAATAGALRCVDATYASAKLLSLIKAFFFWPRMLGDLRTIEIASRHKIAEDCMEMFLSQYSGEPQESRKDKLAIKPKLRKPRVKSRTIE